MILKLKVPFARLDFVAKNPETSRWFVHFLRTHRVIAELGADPKQYLQAQFDKMAWARGRYPFPFGMYSDNAVLAYLQRASKYADREIRKAGAEQFQHDPFQHEERKLESWSRRLGCSRKHVLRHHPNEFTPAFLRKMGVWSLVREAHAD